MIKLLIFFLFIPCVLRAEVGYEYLVYKASVASMGILTALGKKTDRQPSKITRVEESKNGKFYLVSMFASDEFDRTFMDSLVSNGSARIASITKITEYNHPQTGGLAVMVEKKELFDWKKEFYEGTPCGPPGSCEE